MSIIGEAESLVGAVTIPGAGPAAWALKHWKLILTGIGAAVLGLMLVMAKADARHWHKQADQNKAALAIEEQKNGINLASIATLQTALNEKNAESDRRARDYAASRAQDAQDVAAADARAKATANRIATLQGIAAHASANPTCKAPDALLAGADGL